MDTEADTISMEDLLRASVRVVIGATLDMLQEDPHQWSTRPCATCRAITAIVARPFGCYLYMEQRGAKV